MTVVNRNMLLASSPIVEMLEAKSRGNGVSHGLSEAGYDIRIKQAVTFRPGQYHITGTPLSGPKHSIYDPAEHHPDFLPLLKDGNFCLASAIEEFDMPEDLVGIVHDKSTWARQGLSVFNTVIEPGWKGFLTLELVYHGNQPLHIPAGSGIAQVIFHELTQRSHYSGKYQNQADEPVASIFT